MKLTKRFTNGFAALLVTCVALSFVTAAGAQNEQEGKAIVRALLGTPEYSKAGAAFVPLKVNTILHAGDVVKTKEGDHVDLFLGKNNGVVQVTPNSTLLLDKLSFKDTGAEIVSDTQLDVRAGTIHGKVNKMANASKYEIKTPRGVAGIRGTKYSVSASGQVTVAEGTVIVVYVIGGVAQPPITVHAGETVMPGGTPKPAPKDLINDILNGLHDAENHVGNQIFIEVFVAPVVFEPFISPTLPPGGAVPPPAPPGD